MKHGISKTDISHLPPDLLIPSGFLLAPSENSRHNNIDLLIPSASENSGRNHLDLHYSEFDVARPPPQYLTYALGQVYPASGTLL